MVTKIGVVLKIIWQPEKSEPDKTKEPGIHNGQDDHPLSERAFKVIADPSSARNPPSITSRSPSLFNGKPSIAAATVLGVVTFAALLFLAIWYIRHKRRHRQHKSWNQNQDFGQSEITLGEDTSKTLDYFLMKDIPHERTSFMFSRSESPSITFVVEEAERSSLNKCYSPSTNSLSKIETITRISTDGARPSLLSSELTAMTSLQSTAANDSSSKPASATPRTSMSSSQLWTTITSSTECQSLTSRETTVPPTAESSQLWTTTTGSTETGSVASRETQFRSSNGSRASSRLSAQGPAQAGVKLSQGDNTGLRRYHARERSQSSQSTVVGSPVAESGSDSLS
ncbi:uncharacterized protein N7473_011811 [Penicillium subrubescens]|nr:uncharacterized protein N7473_011811 [Penicillium subrubescens]KAJ5880758.1 hypothetical protein N7473_011811 [Penicillium subrubescens]